MIASFLLTLRALVRGRVVVLLLGAAGLIHLLMPGIVRSDGTAAGAFEMHIRSVPGCVATTLLLTMLTVACGLFAREREDKRLALALVRPTRAFGIAAGKWLALLAVAAATLAFSSVLTLAFPPTHPPQTGDLPPCRHHYAPSLPPPVVMAGRMLEHYLRDPQTPEAVKRASRGAVLTLLTTKEMDRYDVIRPGETNVWPFAIPALAEQMARGAPLVLRVRFSTQFEMRTPVAGVLRLGDYAAVVSNNTQAVIDLPFVSPAKAEAPGAPVELSFVNMGSSTVMLRPRRDIEVLAPADSFAANLLRAQLEVWALAALLAAYGLFLSAALSRPVAVFTALVTLAVVLIAPSAIAQFPDEFHAPLADRIGLAISRGIQAVTSSVSEPSPISDLATSRAVEFEPLLRTILGNVVVLPAFLLALAAFIARRKPLADLD